MPRLEAVRLLPDRARPANDALPRLFGQLALAGLVLVLAWPAARGHSLAFGWLPMWLVAMPACAAWVLHGCPVPRRGRAPVPTWIGAGSAAVPARRGRVVQARRRTRHAPGAARAA
ncbi:hypothetical protein GCM10028862_19640 [Luteimonas pelagia]